MWSCLGVELELLHAPCRNGVIYKGAKVYDLSGDECNVGKLWYSADYKKAMVEIVRLNNAHISMCLPATMVMLVDATVPQDIDVPSNVNPVQYAFLVYSAIKRAVTLATQSKPAACLHPLLPATLSVKRLVGLRGKDMVSNLNSDQKSWNMAFILL
jgi:hypothetical protein